MERAGPALDRLAAEQDYAPAQFRLGRAFMEGRGLPRDRTKAIAWYERAAAAGDADASAALKAAEAESSGEGAEPSAGPEGAGPMEDAAPADDTAAADDP